MVGFYEVMTLNSEYILLTARAHFLHLIPPNDVHLPSAHQRRKARDLRDRVAGDWID